jgi:hypothetical protein
VRINGRCARKVPRVLCRGRQYRFRRTESQILAIGADLRWTFRPDCTNLAQPLFKHGAKSPRSGVFD